MAAAANDLSNLKFKDLAGKDIVESLKTGLILYEGVVHDAIWTTVNGTALDQKAKDELITQFKVI